jgi:hypothetical protein
MTDTTAKPESAQGGSETQHYPATWDSDETVWYTPLVPAIDCVYDVELPSGRAQVNRFDFNLAYACDKYVQLENTVWIKARNVKVLGLANQRVAS